MANLIKFGSVSNFLPPKPQITFLQYIQSSGEQYIDTGFVPNQDTRVYAQCALALASSTAGLFGVRESSSARAFQFVTQANYYRSDYNGTLSNVTNNNYGATMFYVDKNKNVTDINGLYSSEAPYGTFTCPGNMYVFATNNNGSLYAYSSASLYSMKIYNNGTLVRDFKPAKNPDGVIGLWDAKNEMFYSNSGTGTFTAGPEV